MIHPPPLAWGRKYEFLLATQSAPELCLILSPKRGERSAERRIQPMSARFQGAEACQKSGRARLPALRSGTRQRSRNRLWLSSRTTFPGTRLGRVFCPPRACPVQRAPRRPVLLPAKWCPGAARVRTANPPAGTALAPLSGLPSGKAPSMSKMKDMVTYSVSIVKDLVSELETFGGRVE